VKIERTSESFLQRLSGGLMWARFTPKAMTPRNTISPQMWSTAGNAGVWKKKIRVGIAKGFKITISSKERCI
jgi:hypothetical protein